MSPDIDLHQQVRERFHAVVTQFSDGQLFAIPDGFRNNIAWNVGHVVVTQQLLHYRLCGLDTYVDESTISMFRKGTSPKDWNEKPQMASVFDAVLELPKKLSTDFDGGRFETFNEYTTSAGVVLHNIDEAIRFNNFHEGIHLGIILTLAKLV